MDEIEQKGRIKEAQINNAIGVFILVFGIVILFGMLYTETFVQHMTDLVAGVLLMLIGGLMIWRARKKLNSLRKNKKKEDQQ
ncbi:MAG: manganese efflux pump [Arenibacter sp.]|nr:manganese efflux pump [Arenibacter sp.]